MMEARSFKTLFNVTSPPPPAGVGHFSGLNRSTKLWILTRFGSISHTNRASTDQVSYNVHRRQNAFTISSNALASPKSASKVAATNFLELESTLSVNNDSQNKETPELLLNTGFLVPDNNTFGHSFRDYEKEYERKSTIEQFYRTNHIYQTHEFAKHKKKEYGNLQKAKMGIWECCELLNDYVDESDPDLDEPQIEHLLQSAEAIRRDYPDQDWLHLTALIHDLGKVMLHPSFGGEPQWCVVGDTFPLGCAFNKSIVHHKYFEENPDYQNPIYSTKLGIYSQNCGLDKITMSWGHDEYMYLVAKGNNTTLPPAALFIIRFHSFYALHGSRGAYAYLMNDEDKEMLRWLQLFSKYDLYTKSKVKIDQEEVKPYYLSLIEKYFPAKLRW